MKSSLLLNRSVALRALKDIFLGLRERKLTRRFVDTAAGYAGEHCVHLFPGFTLFTPGKKFPPYQWFLPKTRVSVLKFLEVYEKLAQMDGTSGASPGAVAAKIYPVASQRAEFLRSFKRPEDWRSAATMLVASSQWLGGDIEHAGDHGVQARLGPGLLEVTEKGCWSATRRSLIRSIPAATPAWPVTGFPATQTGNPHLLALAELRDLLDPNLRYAGTVLAAALNQAVVTPEWLRQQAEAALLESLSIKSKDSKRLERAAAALIHCSEILENMEFDIVPLLHMAAVPNLISSRKFRKIFGDPGQAPTGRETKAETRLRWQQVLDQVFGDLQDANL